MYKTREEHRISFRKIARKEYLELAKMRKRPGYYPERILVDQIYRTRENRDYCKEHGIRMSGPKLGRPPKNKVTTKEEYQDNTDRIEVERFFSTSKRGSGAGLIKTKLYETSMASVALSVLVTNMFATERTDNFLLFFMNCGDEPSTTHFIEIEDSVA